jgi:hypothetical protein
MCHAGPARAGGAEPGRPSAVGVRARANKMGTGKCSGCTYLVVLGARPIRQDLHDGALGR